MPAALVGDSSLRMRYQREAKLLASLNHPNIAVIYDLIEPDEAHGYLILEYIPGTTLAERIAGEPIALEQALGIGRQVADAVSAAHAQGVIHRDLKPGNIKITPEGRVKVLDFGLAKAYASQSANSDVTVTQPGRVIGTPTYLSPEQARGKPTDQRTDIWSFGCILYEMLTGHSPFEGETVTDSLARVIEREPDWALLPPDTPTNIRALLRQCLEKDPERRLEKIALAGDEISAALEKNATGALLATAAKSRPWAALVGVSIITLLLALALWFGLTGRPVPSQVRVVVLPFENLGWLGDIDKAQTALQQALQTIESLESVSTTDTVKLMIDVDIYAGQYQEALDRIGALPAGVDCKEHFIPIALLYAQVYTCMGKQEPANEYYEEARIILEAKIREQPEDARLCSSLGLAYAGLGLKQAAVQQGCKALELLPLSTDAMRGLLRIEDLARIYVMVGDFDAAVEQIEFLLSRPGRLSVPLLRLDPAWQPLSKHRPFQTLLGTAHR